MNSYKSILEHIYETPFNFGPDESNELRELLQIKYDMFSKNYLFTILVETINMRNEGNFKNVNELMSFKAVFSRTKIIFLFFSLFLR